MSDNKTEAPKTEVTVNQVCTVARKDLVKGGKVMVTKQTADKMKKAGLID